MTNLFDTVHLQLIGDFINVVIDFARGTFSNIGAFVFGIK